jgi:hypothetical protein
VRTLRPALATAGALVLAALLACESTERRELLAGSSLGGVVRAGHVTVIWVHEGTDVEPLGGRLTTIPDVNGDGVPDLVSFDELAGREAGGDEAVGRVTVLSGRHGKLLWTLRGEESGDGLGAAVAPVGDVDRDGTPDIAVGAPQGGPTKAHRAPGVPWSVDERGPGYVLVLSGRSGRLLRRIDGSYPGSEFGRALAGLADIDGDRKPELAIGAPLDGTVGPSAGMISFVSMQEGTPTLQSAPGANDEAHLGVTLASLPDMDQDGVADLAAGAFERGAYELEYHVGVRSGRDGALLRPLSAAQHAVEGLGVPDIDGDGAPDELIGMLQAFGEPGGNLARGVLLSGQTHAVLRTFDEPPYAPIAGMRGFQLGGRATDLRLAANDVDGDGHGDVVLGAFSRTLEPSTISVFSGDDGALLLYVCDGATTLPGGLALPGDLDGDDRADLVVGLDLPGARSSLVALSIELPPR